MAAPMTNAELAILSLIAEKPHHGYEIEQVIDARGMRDWTEVGFSSIYYILKKLESQGLILSRAEPSKGRGPGRKVYHLTPSGRSAWRQAALSALANPERVYSAFQLGLANLPAMSTPDVIHALQNYSGQLRDRLDYVRARRDQSGDDLPFHVAAMFDLSLTLIEAERKWIQRFLRTLPDANQTEEPK
jgi:DNA-binding PadR family transcriptional regulator